MMYMYMYVSYAASGVRLEITVFIVESKVYNVNHVDSTLRFFTVNNERLDDAGIVYMYMYFMKPYGEWRGAG